MPDSKSIAAGTPIEVELGEVVDSGAVFEPRYVLGTVLDDVKGADGRLAIPAESAALMIVRDAAKNGTISKLVLGLNRLQVAGKTVRSENKDLALLTLQDDSAGGDFHRSVHLYKQSRVTFKLETAIPLR